MFTIKHHIQADNAIYNDKALNVHFRNKVENNIKDGIKELKSSLDKKLKNLENLKERIINWFILSEANIKKEVYHIEHFIRTNYHYYFKDLFDKNDCVYGMY